MDKANVIIDDIYPGTTNPIAARHPGNQLKYSNGYTRQEMIDNFNNQNPDRNLIIPEKLQLRYYENNMKANYRYRY